MKLKWKNEAVSPVIATILMVAITVVLAAVLYVMVIGIAGNGGTIAQAPVGSWQGMVPLSNHSAKLTFGNIEPIPQMIDLRIIIEDEHGGIFNITWPSAAINSSNFPLSCDKAGIAVSYHDSNPTIGLIGAGDFIEISGLEHYTFYYVKIYHGPSDCVISMAGDTNFQTYP